MEHSEVWTAIDDQRRVVAIDTVPERPGIDRLVGTQGGTYLRTSSYGAGPDAAGPEELSEELRATSVVDSYSMSVTLCLATLGFVSVFKPITRQRRKIIDRHRRNRHQAVSR